MNKYGKIWKKNGILVKRETKLADGEKIHYHVPKEYDYWQDTGEKMEHGHREDFCCTTPCIKFNKESGKWGLHFSGADNGGYDASHFVYYFDDLNDILEFMGFPLTCSCVK